MLDNLRLARKAHAVLELLPLAERFAGALQGERQRRAQAKGESAVADPVAVSALELLDWLATLELSLDNAHHPAERAADPADLDRLAALIRSQHSNTDEAILPLATRAAHIRLVKDRHGIARLAYLAEIEVQSQARRSARHRPRRPRTRTRTRTENGTSDAGRACTRPGHRHPGPLRSPRPPR